MRSEQQKTETNSMLRRILICLLPIGLLLPVALIEAQQAKKVPRIGYISVASPSVVLARVEAFRHGLRELGYVKGKSIVIEYRYAEGNRHRLPDLIAELIRLKVDVVLSAGGEVTRAAKEATRTIPIVMAFDSDPVGNGFVASLARPGGNVTGLSTVSQDLSGKLLELLQEVVPRLSRVAVIGDSTTPGNAQALKVTEATAAALRVQVHYLDVVGPNDIESAFQDASKAHCDGVLLLPSALLLSQRKELAKLAVKTRLPAIHSRPEYVDAGGLMFYGVDANDLFRRAAVYVDKILKGAKPGDLPVEQPTKFELVINLKAAKQIGLTTPPNVLARADRVIK